MTSFGIPHSRPWITNDDLLNVRNCINSNMISYGDQANLLTSQICKTNKIKYGKPLSSGTAALAMALKVLGIQPNDEVILPTYVCKNVLNAVLSLKAVPIFSDVNEFGVITNSTIEKVISRRTKVIIGVHTFGNHCDIGALHSFNLPVIEDACQAFGSFFGGSAAGSFGTLAVYSFQATKMMTTGEGGMLLTNNSKYSDLIIEDNFFNQLSPISDVQAALGLSQFSRLAEILEKRKNLRNIYIQALSNSNLKNSNDPNSDVLFRFTVKVHGNVDSLIYKFANFGINIRRGVESLLHRHFNILDKEFPGALNIFNSTISIPFYPSLKSWEVEKIISHLPELSFND